MALTAYVKGRESAAPAKGQSAASGFVRHSSGGLRIGWYFTGPRQWLGCGARIERKQTIPLDVLRGSCGIKARFVANDARLTGPLTRCAATGYIGGRSKMAFENPIPYCDDYCAIALLLYCVCYPWTAYI